MSVELLPQDAKLYPYNVQNPILPGTPCQTQPEELTALPNTQTILLHAA